MPSNPVLDAFKAETLLADANILTKIQNLKVNIQYATDEDKISFDDYLTSIRKEVDNIPRLELETDIAPGTESHYTSLLITSMEKIVDDCGRTMRKLSYFKGRLLDAQRQVNNLKSEFIAWYLLSAAAVLSAMDVKLAAKEVKSLAESEFSRLMEDVDIKIESVLEDVKLEISQIAQHKSTQKEKMELGRDQAVESWSSLLPSFGGTIAEDDPADKFTKDQDEDEDDVPDFVSNKPKIASIQGVFKKTLPPAFLTPIQDENGNQVIMENLDDESTD